MLPLRCKVEVVMPTSTQKRLFLATAPYMSPEQKKRNMQWLNLKESDLKELRAERKLGYWAERVKRF